jgi:hypothetical protein
MLLEILIDHYYDFIKGLVKRKYESVDFQIFKTKSIEKVKSVLLSPRYLKTDSPRRVESVKKSESSKDVKESFQKPINVIPKKQEKEELINSYLKKVKKEDKFELDNKGIEGKRTMSLRKDNELKRGDKKIERKKNKIDWSNLDLKSESTINTLNNELKFESKKINSKPRIK